MMPVRRVIPSTIPHEYAMIQNRCGYHKVQVGDAEFPFVGECVRLAIDQQAIKCINDIPVYQNDTASILVRGLPGFKPGTYYIVSELTARMLPYRHDLLIPNHDGATLDKHSRVCKVDSFLSYAQPIV